MSNPEWRPFREEEYPRYCYSAWDENRHPYHTFAEEILADSIISDATLVTDTMKLTLSPPIFNVTDGVPITFKHSDKATLTQQVVDGQLSLRIQENTDLQSIKICVGNRTWVIPLDTLPLLPPSMPKKR